MGESGHSARAGATRVTEAHPRSGRTRAAQARPWVEHALDELRRAGHRSSRPRTAVVEALGRRSCLVTAPRLAEDLRAEGRNVGIATVYRTLELLDERGLVQRLDSPAGPTLYEPAGPRGEHHHHLVCARCERVVAFEDDDLERAIVRAGRRLAGRVETHDVTLRGLCPSCAGGRPPPGGGSRGGSAGLAR